MSLIIVLNRTGIKNRHSPSPQRTLLHYNFSPDRLAGLATILGHILTEALKRKADSQGWFKGHRQNGKTPAAGGGRLSSPIV